MESPWILVICHEFPPIGGGAGKNLFLLCRELARRGLKVRVWTGDPGAARRGSFDFPVEYLSTGRKRRFETSLKGFFAFAARAVAKAWREGPPGGRAPVLVLSCLGIPAGLAGALVSRRFRAPHAVWYHGSDVHGGRPAGPGLLQRLLVRRLALGAAHNLFISPGLRSLAARLGPLPGASILPSCPSPEIQAAADAIPDPPPAAEPGGRDGRYLLFLGRLEPVKNPLLLVAAVALLKAKGAALPKVRLVGGGAQAEVVRAEVRIRTLSAEAAVEPPAPFEQVPALLAGAYALVVPSRAEGFNTTVLEAALFGVPTVASDTLGLRDFVVPGETGLLFPEGDAEALARALETLAADPALRDRLGRSARAAARPYRAERVADDFLRAVAPSAPALSAWLAPAVRRATPHPGGGRAAPRPEERTA